MTATSSVWELTYGTPDRGPGREREVFGYYSTEGEAERTAILAGLWGWQVREVLP